MSEKQPANSMLKSILILKDEELDGAGGDGVGEEGSRPKKNVTFNRVVAERRLQPRVVGVYRLIQFLGKCLAFCEPCKYL